MRQRDKIHDIKMKAYEQKIKKAESEKGKQGKEKSGDRR
jgi:hypothetical protein